jgi:hypothetical protein
MASFKSKIGAVLINAPYKVYAVTRDVPGFGKVEFTFGPTTQRGRYEVSAFDVRLKMSSSLPGCEEAIVHFGTPEGAAEMLHELAEKAAKARREAESLDKTAAALRACIEAVNSTDVADAAIATFAEEGMSDEDPNVTFSNPDNVIA